MPSPLYAEPAYYRMLFRERTHDLEFYLRATDGVEGEILELGVGEGRVAFALAAAGRRVLGVDSSEPMLRALELRRAEVPAEVSARVRTVCADARALALDRTFDRITLPFNALAHFHEPAEQAALFEVVRAHLADGGELALDVTLPDPQLLSGGAASTPRFEHPRTGAVCRVEEAYDYDAYRQVLTIQTTLVERESGRSQVLTLALRQLFPQETRLLLEHHGFEVVERFDGLGDCVAWRARRG